ncbi:uncharacterized protein G2W53_016846 [Senna tora]|uniref:Uncharacterized protein n=1 Tax=Senna tora TaxID=362788 RepID=A0A834WJW5_9FABA|nr:uncharacterized protein G2W53_016846 [Senna tora]
MAHQEEGWPLGLRLLNGRIGLVENNDDDFCESMLTASPTSSTDSSSDLESQSSGSFFHDKKTITLGSIIGVSTNILEDSQRRSRRRRTRIIMVDPTKDNNNNSSSSSSKKNHNNKMMMMKPFLFSLCSKQTTDAVVSVKYDDAPSLAQYLEAERRGANTTTFRLNQSLSLLEQNNG